MILSHGLNFSLIARYFLFFFCLFVVVQLRKLYSEISKCYSFIFFCWCFSSSTTTYYIGTYRRNKKKFLYFPFVQLSKRMRKSCFGFLFYFSGVSRAIEKRRKKERSSAREKKEGIDNVKILIVSHLRKLLEEQHLKKNNNH